MAFKNGDQHCDVGPLCPLQFYRAAVSHTVSITDTDSIAWAMCGSREVNMLHCHRHRDAFDQVVVPEDMRLIRVQSANMAISLSYNCGLMAVPRRSLAA